MAQTTALCVVMCVTKPVNASGVDQQLFTQLLLGARHSVRNCERRKDGHGPVPACKNFITC